MTNLVFDSLEVILALWSIAFLGRKLLPFLSFSIKALLPTLVWAGLYIGTLLLLRDTYLGSAVFAPFVERGLVSGSVRFLAAYAVILVLSEELFFRIYLGTRISIVLAALIFSIVHWRPDHIPLLMFPFLFVLALLQSALLKKTGSLWSIVFTHLAALTTLVVLYG